jgi:hypothetical protein
MKLSLLSIDVGFDCRLHGLVRLPLPLKGQHEVAHHPGGDCIGTLYARGLIQDIAETLARSGYSVVPFRTANGRDVQCTPPEKAPPGDGDMLYEGAPVWAVQAKNDNYWCRGSTYYAALERAGWTERELIENGE